MAVLWCTSRQHHHRKVSHVTCPCVQDKLRDEVHKELTPMVKALEELGAIIEPAHKV